jgi:hypothetical protein
MQHLMQRSNDELASIMPGSIMLVKMEPELRVVRAADEQGSFSKTI